MFGIRVKLKGSKSFFVAQANINRKTSSFKLGFFGRVSRYARNPHVFIKFV